MLSEAKDDKSVTEDISENGEDSSESDDDTEYETDDEVDPIVDPPIFTAVPNQNISSNEPIQLEILTPNQEQSSSLPLCMMLNARSLYNKAENFRNLLYQICPDLSIISETWEREKLSIEDIISSEQFEVISYRRQKVNNKLICDSVQLYLV